jgi:hypothetical protein
MALGLHLIFQAANGGGEGGAMIYVLFVIAVFAWVLGFHSVAATALWVGFVLLVASLVFPVIAGPLALMLTELQPKTSGAAVRYVRGRETRAQQGFVRGRETRAQQGFVRGRETRAQQRGQEPWWG